jgi:ribosomal protein L18E
MRMALAYQTRDYARRLFDRQGDRALLLTRDMIAHLNAIGDSDRLKDWRRIAAEIERLVRQRAPRAGKVELKGSRAEAGFWRRVGMELERIRHQRQVD